MNLEIIDTGGGCSGLYMPHPLGRVKYGYFLITDETGARPPNKGGKAIVVWYTNDAQFLSHIDIDTWEGM